MALPERTCFVIMPYLPALHYFYLYLKRHVEQKHGLVCERADERVLTQPILDRLQSRFVTRTFLLPTAREETRTSFTNWVSPMPSVSR